MAERIHEEGVEPLSSFGPRIKVKGQPTADNGGCIMTQHKTSCLAAVLASLCITLYMAGKEHCERSHKRVCENI